MVAMRCSTCGGDAGGHETCDLCAERELGRREKQRSEQLAWLYTCAHRALKLARTYGVADGKDGLRARGCLAQVKVYRKDIRGLRDVQGRGVLSVGGEEARPGVTKSRALPDTQKPASRAG